MLGSLIYLFIRQLNWKYTLKGPSHKTFTKTEPKLLTVMAVVTQGTATQLFSHPQQYWQTLNAIEYLLEGQGDAAFMEEV